jgi:hypothetical protein
MLCLGFAVLLCGCARVATTTTLRADGSATRHVVYSAAKSGMEKKLPRVEDFFKIPEGVSSTRSEDKSALHITTTRELTAGSGPLQDVTLTTDKGKPVATSTVLVSRRLDGTIEYMETIHSIAPEASLDKFNAPPLRAKIKALLPEEYRKTEVIDAVTRGVAVNIVHAVAGPPDPLLFELILSPDAAKRKITSAMLSDNLELFRTQMPNLTEAQARAMAADLSMFLAGDGLDEIDFNGPQQTQNDDPSGLTPLFFEVAFPGKVVETNGIVDPLTGRVYWSMLPMAADLGDVKLRLVVRP